MKELFYILLSIPVFFLYFNFPINYFRIKKSFITYQVSYYDCILINIVINLNLLLILSFFSINFKHIFIAQCLFSLFFIALYFKDYFFFLKKNYIYLLFIFLFLFFLFIKIAANPSLTWDGLHWFYKTQTFYQGGSIQNLNTLPMNYYPHLGTYLWAFFWKNAFIEVEYFGRFFYIFFYVLTIASAVNFLSKNFTDLEKIMFFFLIIILTLDFFLLGGYQDYLLFCLFYFYSRFFLFYKNDAEKKLSIFFLLFFSIQILLWTKQEGFFYSIFLFIIYFIHSKDIFSRKILSLIIIFVLFSLFYFIKVKFYGGIKFNHEIIHADLINLLNIDILIHKLFFITKYFFISFFKYPLWILIIISAYFLFNKKFLKDNIYFVSFALLSFALVYAIYLQTSMNIEWLIPVTLSRILFAFSGFYLLIVVYFLNSLKKNSI